MQTYMTNSKQMARKHRQALGRDEHEAENQSQSDDEGDKEEDKEVDEVCVDVLRRTGNHQ
jgi:hypothetical protein